VCGGKHDRRYERRHARKQHNVDDELRHGTFIPATGYYDWHDTPSGKQPYYFTRRDGDREIVAQRPAPGAS
jgi:putative SOS response-associated peptidase YedK